jgi:4a-hydroxytetrahydrobiopterin dehydratase
MARLIRALRAESYPLDHSNIDYAVGDMEVEDGYGTYVPVRELTGFLMQESYENSESLIDDLQKIARGAKVIEMPPRNKRLADRNIVPSRKGTPPLDSRQAHDFLVELGHGWSFTDDGHLHKIYRFKDFSTPMAFANRIAKIAEKEDHHPDLHVSWGKCVVEMWTHSINGLSEADFILAAKVEEAS